MVLLSLISCCPHVRRKMDRRVQEVLDAIKGRRVQSNSRLAVDTVEWLANAVALILDMQRLPRPLVLIPVPDSHCTLPADTPRSMSLAEAVATHTSQSGVFDGLRWRRAMKPSHRGGTRDPEELSDNLVLLGSIPFGTPVIVDDVVTTGNHLRAAAAKIISADMHCGLALCAVRITRVPVDAPFRPKAEIIPDFCPVPRIGGSVTGGRPTSGRLFCPTLRPENFGKDIPLSSTKASNDPTLIAGTTASKRTGFRREQFA
jgi:hypothetical protein